MERRSDPPPFSFAVEAHLPGHPNYPERPNSAWGPEQQRDAAPAPAPRVKQYCAILLRRKAGGDYFCKAAHLARLIAES